MPVHLTTDMFDAMPVMNRPGILAVLMAAFASSAAAAPKAAVDISKLPPAASGAVDFARDIQPLFVKNCYSCHGPDKQKNGLRLDLKAAALAGGDSGKVIVPGKSAESKLIHLVAGLVPDTVMPQKGERLASAQVAKLRAWIDAGANWPDEAGRLAESKKSDHWAFKAPALPALPKVKDAKWPQNPIDKFVLARLEKERTKPSLEADRYTLIRRLSLDLLGLPPKPEEVREFIADTSANAYEKLVDRLLDSPHFGERWARHWLDLARYADSDGYEKDKPRPYAYTYRDWVIKAINDDLPYDRFSIEQLAGDLLQKPTHEQLVATGFHRQTLTNTEGGVDQEEFRCKAIVDRVSTTSAVWLGLTMGCCECHSHKYDPLTQREFYQFFAFFNNASEKNIPSPQADELAAYESAKKKWDAENAKFKSALDAYVKSELSPKLDAWLKTSPAAVRWSLLTPEKLAAKNGTVLKTAKDASVVASGKAPAKETYTVEADAGSRKVTGFRLEAIAPGTAKKKSPGRAKDGNFVLTHFKVQVQLPGEKPRDVVLQNASADHSQDQFAVASALLGTDSAGWAVAPQADRTHVAVFECKELLTLPEGARLVFTLDHQYETGYTLGQFRLAVTDATRPLRADIMADTVVEALDTPADQRTEKQRAALAKFFREQVDPEAKRLHAALDALAKKAPVFPPTTAASIVEEQAGRKTAIHVRGNFLDRGVEVQPGTPAVLHGFKPRVERPDRLDLANWLFDSSNPLTARVTVNHVWKNLIGRGLVASLDDFGTRGEKPTHPELLDWLALNFSSPARMNPTTESYHFGLNWSRKELIKLIVTSATYKQASAARPDLRDRDPNNLLLARQNRLRLEAESVRDAYLAASGLLNEKIGGPSIRPPLPADIAALGYANSVKWTESTGAEKNRRGLYIFFQRTVPYPMLMTFDAPDSNSTCARRERSNTPLQALTLLNDPVFYECAQALGRRMVAFNTADPFEKIRFGFQLCTARPPTTEEFGKLTKLYETQLKLAQASPENAANIAGCKKDDADAAEKATFVALGRVMLNLDEFVTRD
ncbi:MAG: PSD1 domain-containing protein [Verrucomicrobia bacterium]|nr:PSD1 domain-containing protein [Verrucomicrobiota bacterium]